MKMINWMLEMYKKYKEIILYLIIGGLTTVISVGSFAILLDVCHVDKYISNIASWIIAVLFAFFTNKLIVFGSKMGNNDFKEFVSFIACRLASLGVEMLGIFIMVDLASFNALVTKIILQFVIVVLNYVFSKFFIFVKKDNK